MTQETQATTDQEQKTITLAYTSHDFERGTDEEVAGYKLRSANTTPDELDEDMISKVYDERLEIDVPAADVEQADGVVDLLETIYHGVERDQIPQVDRTKYRSPMLGDVFTLDGTAYVVARIGFDELETAADVFATDA